MQAAIRASTARCPPYRGTNVSRYAPTGQRPARCQDRRYIWWPRDHPSPRLDRLQLTQNAIFKNKLQVEEPKPVIEETTSKDETEIAELPSSSSSSPQPENPDCKDVADDGQQPSTSASALDTELNTKRLYSTVLSMSAPSSIGLATVGCVRLAQKLVTPGILKLNPKIVLPGARIRPPNVDHKFEELEKEALEQYKPSDESIDTKFQELEKQAEEQYSNSNSNTSCSSTEKKLSNPPSETDTKNKQPVKFHKERPVDSVVIYSQNFPDLNTKQTSSDMNLKNFHGPPRGDKKDSRRINKSRLKGDSQRAASDTDYEARDTNVKSHKGPMRWSLHAVPPKKRHLTVYVSDFSSDDDIEDTSGSLRDAGPQTKSYAGKMKMSAHGGGDLHPIMRKT